MKFTDILFEFPSIVYNTQDIIKDAVMAESLNLAISTEFGIAKTKIPVDEIIDGMYHEAFARDTPMEEVNREGFKCTMLYTKSFGNFVINWGIDTFEEALNKHLDMLDEQSLEVISKNMEEKEHNIA